MTRAGEVQNNMSVLLDGERITAVADTQTLRAQNQDVPELKLDEHALLPGLVNAHTHAAMSLMRGLADDLPLMEWLEQHIWPTEAAHVNREFVADGSRLAIAEMLQGGTTTFSDMYFFAEETAGVAAQMGIRAVIGMIVIGFPSAWAKTTDEYFRKGLSVHDQFRSHERISAAFAPHAPYTVDDESLRRIATLAEELDAPVHIHLHETAQEVEDALTDHGERPIARLARLGLMSPRLIAVHMTQLNEAEIDMVAEHGVSVVHCPESNLKLASGFAPVSSLVHAKANIAIGTDGAASNNDLDMLSEIRTASLLAKGHSRDPCAFTAAQALWAATMGGAIALGQESSIGSLEAGKYADLVAVNLGDYRAQPVYDACSQIVYATHRDQVEHVWVAGEHRVSGGRLVGEDPGELAALADKWRRRISAPSASQS